MRGQLPFFLWAVPVLCSDRRWTLSYLDILGAPEGPAMRDVYPG